jgi:hypothetical protein
MGCRVKGAVLWYGPYWTTLPLCLLGGTAVKDAVLLVPSTICEGTRGRGMACMFRAAQTQQRGRAADRLQRSCTRPLLCWLSDGKHTVHTDMD